MGVFGCSSIRGLCNADIGSGQLVLREIEDRDLGVLFEHSRDRDAIRMAAFVGHIASFDLEGHREITYWIGREDWGRGIATSAYESSCSWRQHVLFTLAQRATTPRRFVC